MKLMTYWSSKAPSTYMYAPDQSNLLVVIELLLRYVNDIKPIV